MKTETCSECKKIFRRTHASIVSCSLQKSDWKYISKIRNTRYSSTNRYRSHPHKILCPNCNKIYLSNLRDEKMKDLISLELLDLLSGKANRIALCNSLEEGNG
jgi:hypothetical protein